MNEGRTITLAHPVAHGGQTYTEIALARPLLKHLRVLDNARGEVERSAALISALSGWPLAAVDQIDAEDFAAIAEGLGDFFGGPPPTGGT